MKTKWNLGADVKCCGVILWVYYAAIIVFNVVIRLVDGFLSMNNATERYLTNLYIFSDFIFPIFAAFIIIFIFSADLTDNSFEYLRSLPIRYSFLLLKRYLRLLVILLIPYVLTIINAGNILENAQFYYNEVPLTVGRFLFLTVPVFLFYAGFAILSTVVLRKISYSSGLCLGLIVEEYISGALFTKRFRLFMNSHQCEYSQADVNNNKIFYIVLSIILLILSMIVISVKAKRKK